MAKRDVPVLSDIPADMVSEMMEVYTLKFGAAASKLFAEGLGYMEQALGSSAGSTREKGIWEQAQNAFRQTIDLKPTFTHAHCNLGVAIFYNGDFQGAQAPLRQAIALDNKDAKACYILGQCLLLTGKASNAVGPLEDAVAIAEENWQNPEHSSILQDYKSVLEKAKAQTKEQYSGLPQQQLHTHYRFRLGEQVECMVEGWATGTVVAHNYREDAWPDDKAAPYQIELDSGDLIYALHDEDFQIRKYRGHSCKVCSKPADKRCSRCHEVYYCNQQCLLADWRQHKQICKSKSGGKSAYQTSAKKQGKGKKKQKQKQRSTARPAMMEKDGLTFEASVFEFEKLAKLPNPTGISDMMVLVNFACFAHQRDDYHADSPMKSEQDMMADATSHLPLQPLGALEQRAAEEDPVAMRELGDVLMYGLFGAERDHVRAQELWWTAAGAGDPVALVSLACHFHNLMKEHPKARPKAWPTEDDLRDQIIDWLEEALDVGGVVSPLHLLMGQCLKSRWSNTAVAQRYPQISRACIRRDAELEEEVSGPLPPKASMALNTQQGVLTPECCAGGSGAGLARKCSSCCIGKDRREYSNAQWKAAAKSRKCKVCIGAPSGKYANYLASRFQRESHQNETCFICTATASVVCGECSFVSYCCVEHQHADSRRHQQMCGVLQRRSGGGVQLKKSMLESPSLQQTIQALESLLAHPQDLEDEVYTLDALASLSNLLEEAGRPQDAQASRGKLWVLWEKHGRTLPEECSVCLDDITRETQGLHISKCGHVFHGACIQKWLQRGEGCPECRQTEPQPKPLPFHDSSVDSVTSLVSCYLSRCDATGYFLVCCVIDDEEVNKTTIIILAGRVGQGIRKNASTQMLDRKTLYEAKANAGWNSMQDVIEHLVGSATPRVALDSIGTPAVERRKFARVDMATAHQVLRAELLSSDAEMSNEAGSALQEFFRRSIAEIPSPPVDKYQAFLSTDGIRNECQSLLSDGHVLSEVLHFVISYRGEYNVYFHFTAVIIATLGIRHGANGRREVVEHYGMEVEDMIPGTEHTFSWLIRQLSRDASLVSHQVSTIRFMSRFHFFNNQRRLAALLFAAAEDAEANFKESAWAEVLMLQSYFLIDSKKAVKWYEGNEECSNRTRRTRPTMATSGALDFTGG
jgi:tetratricopeptide (TPR) repeat protein